MEAGIRTSDIRIGESPETCAIGKSKNGQGEHTITSAKTPAVRARDIMRRNEVALYGIATVREAITKMPSVNSQPSELDAGVIRKGAILGALHYTSISSICF